MSLLGSWEARLIWRQSLSDDLRRFHSLVIKIEKQKKSFSPVSPGYRRVVKGGFDEFGENGDIDNILSMREFEDPSLLVWYLHQGLPAVHHSNAPLPPIPDSINVILVLLVIIQHPLRSLVRSVWRRDGSSCPPSAILNWTIRTSLPSSKTARSVHPSNVRWGRDNRHVTTNITPPPPTLPPASPASDNTPQTCPPPSTPHRTPSTPYTAPPPPPSPSSSASPPAPHAPP